MVNNRLSLLKIILTALSARADNNTANPSQSIAEDSGRLKILARLVYKASQAKNNIAPASIPLFGNIRKRSASFFI